MARALFWLIPFLWSQPNPPSLYRIERWWELGQYERIIRSYETSTSAFPSEGLKYVARSYMEIGETPKAYLVYQAQAKLIPWADWETEDLHRFAQILFARGEIQQVKPLYHLLKTRRESANISIPSPEQLERCAQLVQSPDWEVERVQALDQWAPVYAAWYANGKLYAVSRAPAPNRKLDRKGIPYEYIVPESPLKYPYHHAIIGLIEPDTLLIYLSKGKGDIYYTSSMLKGTHPYRRWRRIAPKPSGRVSLCIDPKTQDIYFTHGSCHKSATGRDLYRCKYLGEGRYALPERLPEPINTSADEDAPFIVGDTLYFASNRELSAGGYDIFFALRVGEREWGAVHALPAPINSCANDIYFYPFSSEHTYFSSDREGKFHVYRAKYTLPPASPASPLLEVPAPKLSPSLSTLPRSRPILRGRIFDKQTQQPIAGEVILVDPNAQKEIYAAQAVPPDQFQLFLPEKVESLYVYVQSVGYITYVQPLKLRGLPSDTVITLNISLLPIQMEATFALRNIYFDFDSDRLRPESLPELERLKRLLQENPNIRVRFSGHTDAIGGDAYNQKLSERRARAVYRWLKEAGIHPIQMEYIGYGETRPIAPNTTEEGRALNRRIEMEIVGIRPSTSESSLEKR